MGRKRVFSTLLIAVVIGTIGLASAPAAVARPSSQVTRLVKLHNIERWERGGRGMRLSSALSRVARAHSLRMARKDHLHHSPDLTRKVRRWRILGENVGVGPSIRDLHEAFMASPGHRANVLERRYREVGVGVVREADGTYWVTVIFRG